MIGGDMNELLQNLGRQSQACALGPDDLFDKSADTFMMFGPCHLPVHESISVESEDHGDRISSRRSARDHSASNGPLSCGFKPKAEGAPA